METLCSSDGRYVCYVSVQRGRYDFRWPGSRALAIAGVSIVFPLQMFTMAVGMMIGMGTSSLISRSLGAGDVKRAERALGNAIFHFQLPIHYLLS